MDILKRPPLRAKMTTRTEELGDEQRAFLQQRVALFGKVLSIINALGLGVYLIIFPREYLVEPWFALYLVNAGLSASMWLTCRTGVRSVRLCRDGAIPFEGAEPIRSHTPLDAAFGTAVAFLVWRTMTTIVCVAITGVIYDLRLGYSLPTGAHVTARPFRPHRPRDGAPLVPRQGGVRPTAVGDRAPGPDPLLRQLERVDRRNSPRLVERERREAAPSPPGGGGIGPLDEHRHRPGSAAAPHERPRRPQPHEAVGSRQPS